MMQNVADRFRAARLTRGLTVQELARLTGYANTRKVAGRIARFELDGTISDELLSRLADVLDIDYAAIEQLVALDAREPAYALQRQDDGRYLTPAYFRWSGAAENAQRCDLAEARAIEGWLQTIGIAVTVVELPSSEKG
jgi:transcriptional regulator with XRE-family HTH domain